MTTRAILLIMQFSQNFIQGLWKDSDPILMIPHFTENHIVQYKKSQKKKAEIKDFLAMNEEQIQNLGLFEPKQVKDVIGFLKYYPQLKIEVSL